MTGARGLLAALLVAATATLSGCAKLDEMRTQFVAMRYLQSAAQRITRLPQQRAQAVRELGRALELRPEDPTLRRRAATLYVAARAYAEALPLLEGMPAADDPRTRVMLAQCLLQTGQSELGAKICREQLSRAAKQRAGKQINRAEYAILLNDAGYMLADAGVDLATAEAALSQAVKLLPREPAIVDSMGWVCFRQGRFREAAFYLERAVRLARREQPEVLYHLGATYARLGRLADAERALRRAIALDPDCEEAKVDLRRLGRELPAPGWAGLVPPQPDRPA